MKDFLGLLLAQILDLLLRVRLGLLLGRLLGLLLGRLLVLGLLPILLFLNLLKHTNALVHVSTELSNFDEQHRHPTLNQLCL